MDINELINEHIGGQHDLYANHVNPQMVKVLRTIGFDKKYVRATGQYLYDIDGNEYLDLLSGYGVFVMGRNHPKIKLAIQQALDADLPNMVQMDAPVLAAVLAKKLLSKFHDGIDTVFFTNSGTEANEGAIKFAKCATKRSKILYTEHAFHGLTNGSLSLNGNKEFRDGFGPLLPDCISVPLGNIDALEKELSKKDIAAFMIEPIQGKGVYSPNDDYYPRVQELCKKYGTLLIADEVQMGMGRTGKWFSYEHWNLEPDIVTVAKALSGGLIPVGAICYRREIYDKVFSRMDRCVVHSNTFGRNTLAMVAGISALEVIEENKLIENAAQRGEELISGLKRLIPKYEMMKDVRGKGCVVAIEFDRPKSFKLKIGWDLIHKVNKGLFGQMVVVPLFSKHRILTQVTGHDVDIVKLLPPLCITQKDVKYFLNAFEQVMIDCHSAGGAWDVGKKLAQQAMRA